MSGRLLNNTLMVSYRGKYSSLLTEQANYSFLQAFLKKEKQYYDSVTLDYPKYNMYLAFIFTVMKCLICFSVASSLDLLSKIPVLPCLLHSMEEASMSNKNLFEWISSQVLIASPPLSLSSLSLSHCYVHADRNRTECNCWYLLCIRTYCFLHYM